MKHAKFYDVFYPEENEKIMFIDSIFKKYSVRDVLELSCRTGSVSISLARKGYNITGIDKNKDMLQFFSYRTRGKMLNINIKQKDIEKIDYKNDFDAVISLRDSLNFIHDYNALLEMLKKIKSSLRKNGIFLLEITNFLSWIERYKKEETLFYQRKNLNIMRYIKRNIEDLHGIIDEKEFGLIDDNGVLTTYCEDRRIKIMRFEEWMKILKEAGFKNILYYSDYKFTVPEKKAKKVIFIAEK